MAVTTLAVATNKAIEEDKNCWIDPYCVPETGDREYESEPTPTPTPTPAVPTGPINPDLPKPTDEPVIIPYFGWYTGPVYGMQGGWMFIPAAAVCTQSVFKDPETGELIYGQEVCVDSSEGHWIFAF